MAVTQAASESNVNQHLSETTVPATLPSYSRLQEIPSPYEKDTILQLKEQDGYARTYFAVYEALARVPGQAGEINSKLRGVAAGGVPVAKFKEAAMALLDVWNALQHVNNNRATCLRLTERCAAIFTSLSQDVDTEDQVLSEDEFVPMLDRLTSSCISISTFFKKYAEVPFIKRYLIRGCIELETSDQRIQVEEVLGSLNGAFLLRVYRLLSRNSSPAIRGCSGPTEYMPVLSLSPPLRTPSHSTLFTASLVTESPLEDEKELLSLYNVRNRLRTLISHQNATDKARDIEDIRVVMNAAIHAHNEVTIIQTVLQIPVEHNSMLQAMRSLQNSLKPVQEDSTIEASVEPTVDPLSPRYGSQSSLEAPDDACMHRLFVRTGVNSLRRISGMDDSSLASWTIAMFEFHVGDQIAVNGALRTYKGAWRNKIVAIKEFRPLVSENDTAGRARAHFTDNVDIWARLRHPNVLRLFGACSVPSYPPWFTVCPYYVNGNLLCYLTKVPPGALVSPDLLVMISDIARGMEYLHAKEVVHGDLKAENILLSEDLRCIVSGFGLNEYLSPDNSHLTRWQAPELLCNSRIRFTTTTDVYAFAMTCLELLTHGKRPWSEVDGDDEVRRHVLNGKRPARPLLDRPWSSDISQLLISWWHKDPRRRPAFSEIVKRLYSVETGKNGAEHTSSSAKAPDLDFHDGTVSAQCAPWGRIALNLHHIVNFRSRTDMQPRAADLSIDASSGSRKKPSRAATYPPPPVRGNPKARSRVRRNTAPTLLQNSAGASLGPEPEAGTRSESLSQSTTIGAVIRHVDSAVKRMSQTLHRVKLRQGAP